MRCTVERIEKITKSYTITDSDIRRAFQLPADAKIFVRVPGGGDWSNTDLEISEEQPLQARATETSDGEYP